ncbi:MAG TPA: DNA-formamidopyrimidine glycosylase family protein, partial [Gaiellaceae bacterium]|nr:DNA-formamidopyrimidine glycosylase family protein [Gaiellaceae bacterium]
MPELPEVEAWRRQLDPLVKKSPIERAGPAHVATLKTIEPSLDVLAGEGFRGVERRAKRFLIPTDDDELVLMVHLMSAGRLKYVPSGGKGAKTPVFRVRFVDGGELQLTEAGSKRRAGVWLLRPDAVREELAHLGPEADRLEVDDVARILASDSRRLHSLLRDQRLIAGIGRAWANEILWSARLSPYALSTQVDGEETERLT